MSIEGIWTGEAYGPFGWESRGIFVFENGRIINGDGRQYSTGSYSLSGDRITAELNVRYYGPPRTAYGEKSEEFTIVVAATAQDGVIDGSVSRPDKPGFEVQYRLTKRMELPSS